MWTKETIIGLLDRSDNAVNKAVLAIYGEQTSDEQASETTRHSNGVGFNAFDARRGTYYAEYIGRRGSLSGRHLELARKMMKKYAGQLAAIGNSKHPEKAQAVEAKLRSADPGNREEARLAQREYDEAADCQCENYDGEMKCPACQIKAGVHPDAAYGNGFGYAEAKQERAAMLRGSW